MTIEPLAPEDHKGVRRAGEIAVAAFAHIPFLATLEEAIEEVYDCLSDDRVVLVARDDTGDVIGWVGARSAYSHAWELHPLAVDPVHQGAGVGRVLVEALERVVSTRGALTLMLGTDDEFGGTTLFGRDLYPDVLGAAAEVESVAGHPVAFYRNLGYVVTGVVPDANGPGKPDIIMCKRLGSSG